MNWLINVFWPYFYSPAANGLFIGIGFTVLVAAYIVLASFGEDYRKATEKTGKGERDEKYKRIQHKGLTSGFRWFIGLFLAGILIIWIQAYTMPILVLAVIAFFLGLAIWGLLWTIWWSTRNVFFALKNLKYK